MSETSAPPAPADNSKPDHIAAIYAALGGQPVLLPIHHGEKGPKYDGWERIGWDDTQNPETRLSFSAAKKDSAGDDVRDEKGNLVREVYRTALYRDLLPVGNVGVRLGCASKLRNGPDMYHLCSIDIDENEGLEPFLAANAWAAETLVTRGRRGGNVWAWVLKDSYPQFAKLKNTAKLNAKGQPSDWGEWRTDGVNEAGAPRAFQTVIWGTHPERSGDGSPILYRRISAAAKPRLIDFAAIVWPEEVVLPWAKTPMEKLVAEHGTPWHESKNGAITLNSPFFVAKYALEHRVLFEPEEGRFYDYGAERGLWIVESEDAIRWKLAADFKKVADDSKKASIEVKRTNAFLQGLVTMLKGCVEKREAFRREAGIIHLQNGMLDVRARPPSLAPFCADYFSRNQIPVELVEGAKCPVFLETLIAGGIKNRDDIDLLQRWAGQLLLGHNLTQKILILTGTAGGGKSTLMNVLSRVVGPSNVAGLRTEHLHQRFELWNYVGKTFLVGADVPGNFLMTEGAHVLKALVGKDVLTAEKKNGESVTIIGDFNIGLTSNSRLKVKLDGDTDAWRRRVLIVNYELPPPARPNPRFLEELLASESSGILNWMVEGAMKLLAEIEEHGRMRLTDGQKERVDSLLAESDSIREFVRKGVAAGDGVDVTGAELITAYVRFCESRGWNPLPTRKVEAALPDALLEVHRVSKRNDISRDGKNQRGYHGLRILPVEMRGADADEGEEGAPAEI